VFGLILWITYVVIELYRIGFVGQTAAENLPMLAVALVAYLVYGLVLGVGYDRLAEHRTFLSEPRAAQ
jgi:fatty-acid desaturase